MTKRSVTQTTSPVELGSSTRVFLKALASETRQEIMMLFAGGAELSVGEVAAQVGLGQSTASEQLALLRDAGLVKAARDGKIVRYRANRDGITSQVAEFQRYLAACC